MTEKTGEKTKATKISAGEKALRIAKKAEAEKEKKEYLARKRKMLPYEAKNFDKVTLFQGTKGYYVIGGHSAVIMNEKIAPEMKMKVRLRDDDDFGCAFPEGIISVADPLYYKMNLPKCHLLKKEFKETDYSITFFLKDKLSEAEYELLSHAEDIKSEELMNMVSSSVVMPNLYRMVRELLEETKRMVSKMDKVAQETIGRQILEDAIELEKAFLLGAGMEGELDVALDKIEAGARAILIDLKIVEDMGIWRPRQCWKIGSRAAQILTQIPVEKKSRRLKRR